MVFTNESMLLISTTLQESLKTKDMLSFRVINPDLYKGLYSGQKVQRKGMSYVYRGYKAWTDLAELLFCKMLTPTVYDEHTVTLSFEKLDTQETFHSIHYGQEKY
ncbi:methyltransferase, partial [Sulfurimonas sp. MAG313]|nr:methyltransferase [Sulfurimonas sp. MAG313]